MQGIVSWRGKLTKLTNLTNRSMVGGVSWSGRGSELTRPGHEGDRRTSPKMAIGRQRGYSSDVVWG